MEVRAKREGYYSELKIHFETANFVSLTIIFINFDQKNSNLTAYLNLVFVYFFPE